MAEDPAMQPDNHYYHAEAKALDGHFKRPFVDVIASPASSVLKDKPGSDDKVGPAFGLKGAISYVSAQTHVSGSQETKHNGGYCTLSTCTVVGLNILEVVTVDRIVAQIFTEHPLMGSVPRISFLATRFENLRICGHPIELEWDLNILGGKPENDTVYTRHVPLIEKLRSHFSRVVGQKGLSGMAYDRYNHFPKQVAATSTTKDAEMIECSLVTSFGGTFPGQCFGHVIHVPDFGEIHLATVKVTTATADVEGTPLTTTVELNMIEAKMGCAATGTVNTGVCITNGNPKG